jgi:diaminohydroxyphosphoribosylaminopyrimidine deaminase/5-amino-6-(5-phosphoribosylamino)uracil reductase
VRQPLRVVFDSRARLPLDSQLLGTLDVSPVLVVASSTADSSRMAALRDAGAEVVVADDIGIALAALGSRDITTLFLEGGRTLAASFVADDLIDECRTFVAPVLLGGTGDPRATGPARRTALSSPSEAIGDDVLITTRFREW